LAELPKKVLTDLPQGLSDLVSLSISCRVFQVPEAFGEASEHIKVLACAPGMLD
jgi:hypothetical protein